MVVTTYTLAGFYNQLPLLFIHYTRCPHFAKLLDALQLLQLTYATLYRICREHGKSAKNLVRYTVCNVDIFGSFPDVSPSVNSLVDELARARLSGHPYKSTELERCCLTWEIAEAAYWSRTWQYLGTFVDYLLHKLFCPAPAPEIRLRKFIKDEL